MHGFDSGHMLWGGWWLLLFWTSVAVLFVWSLRQLFSGSGAHPSSQPSLSALEIAKQRYARGELSQHDYLALVDDLKHETTHSTTNRSEH
jgi:uncharacterized membrane protein